MAVVSELRRKYERELEQLLNGNYNAVVSFMDVSNNWLVFVFKVTIEMVEKFYRNNQLLSFN